MQITHDTMAQTHLNLNSDGLPMYHLRRLGPPSKKQGVVNVMNLYNVTNTIGRNFKQVDFGISSCNYVQRSCLSRCHAHIVRDAKNQHRLHDDSLTGVFINNIKISDNCILHEKDKVIFGYPAGARLQPGTRVQQPDSEHKFIFEVCSCDRSLKPQNSNSGIKSIAVEVIRDSNRRNTLTKNDAILLEEENTLAVENGSRSNIQIKYGDKYKEKRNLIPLGETENKLGVNEPQNTEKVWPLCGKTIDCDKELQDSSLSEAPEIATERKDQETKGKDNLDSVTGEKGKIFPEVYTGKELSRKRHSGEKNAFSGANTEKEESDIRKASDHETEGDNISELDIFSKRMKSFFNNWAKTLQQD